MTAEETRCLLELVRIAIILVFGVAITRKIKEKR